MAFAKLGVVIGYMPLSINTILLHVTGDNCIIKSLCRKQVVYVRTRFSRAPAIGREPQFARTHPSGGHSEKYAKQFAALHHENAYVPGLENGH